LVCPLTFGCEQRVAKVGLAFDFPELVNKRDELPIEFNVALHLVHRHTGVESLLQFRYAVTVRQGQYREGPTASN